MGEILFYQINRIKANAQRQFAFSVSFATYPDTPQIAILTSALAIITSISNLQAFLKTSNSLLHLCNSTTQRFNCAFDFFLIRCYVIASLTRTYRTSVASSSINHTPDRSSRNTKSLCQFTTTNWIILAVRMFTKIFFNYIRYQPYR